LCCVVTYLWNDPHTFDIINTSKCVVLVCNNNGMLLLKQEMEFASNQQIEEELRRALNLNQDQPSSNSRQSKASSHVSGTTSVPSGDIRTTRVGSHHIASSPQNTISNSSPASTAEKIPTASLSSPSINNSKPASCVSEGGARRRRQPRQWKQSPRRLPRDAVGVAGSTDNGKNVAQSQKSAFAAKPDSTRTDHLETTSAMSRAITSALHGSSPSTVTGGTNSRNTGSTRTETEQRGGRAGRGRGRGFQKPIGVSALPGQPLQKPKGDDDTHEVPTSHVALSGQLLLSSADNNINSNVKSATLLTADEHVMDLSNETADKTAQKNVKPLEKKRDKGIILCTY